MFIFLKISSQNKQKHFPQKYNNFLNFLLINKFFTTVLF